ncbi:MAG: hypothetical protein GX923_05665 [Clostridia bacterium]|nr:hypothetical protein [Clostridia bacterium]
MENLVSKLLEANRHLRHDFLNHLQVIWGYVQLDKKEQAIDYIQEVTRYIQGLREINKILDDQLAGELSVYILKIGLNPGFQLSVPEKWNVKIAHRNRYSSFFQGLFSFLMEDINEEKVKLKITILTEEILLEGETLKEGDILDWSNFIALLEKEKFNIIKEEDGNYFRLLVKDQ